MRQRYVRSIEMACVAALVAGFLVQAILSAGEKSLTRDEYVYLASAVAETEFGYYGLLPQQPPYSKLVSGLFLKPLALEVKAPPETDTKVAKYPYAHALLRSNSDKIGEISLMARLPHILLGALLGVAVWYVVRLFYGPWVGFVALFLYSADPNVLAHARLVHTDSDAAAFVFLALVCLVLALRKRPSWTISIAAALFLGLALLAKFSSLALLVIFPALAAYWFITYAGKGPDRGDGTGRALVQESFRPTLFRGGLAAIIVIPLLALVLYRGHVTWYFRGLGMVLEHARRGHPAYLLGEWSDRGWWYYFPVTLAVKTPVPLLILAVTGIACLVRAPLNIRNAPGMMFVVAFGLWLGGAMTGSVNLGLRHILPAYVLLFVIAGAAVAALSRSRPARLIVMALLAWTALSAYRTFPDYIAYFNEPAGGPSEGSRYLVDSNLDWGQEMISLKRYMDEQSIQEIVIFAMGAAIPDIYGVKRLHLKDAKPTPEKPVYCAIGATFRAALRESEGDGESGVESFLSESEQMTILGHSLTVYRVTKPFPEALTRRRASAQASGCQSKRVSPAA